MENATVSESLFTTGVLTTGDREVTTTDRFESAVEGYVDEVAGLVGGDLVTLIRERVEREAIVDPLVALSVEDPRTVAELCALHDHLMSATNSGDQVAAAPPTSDDWLSLLPVLRLFRPLKMPTDGVPESFVPVPATHVPHLTRIYSPSIVYVWLNDCQPCDTVKADLESIFAEPQEVMPFAVYGPDHREFLADEYQVTAGPALLFVLDGSVDSRLYGAQGSRGVEAELATLRELAAGD